MRGLDQVRGAPGASPRNREAGAAVSVVMHDGVAVDLFEGVTTQFSCAELRAVHRDRKLVLKLSDALESP